MSSEYQKTLSQLKVVECIACNGTGEMDDAEPGDISFKVWKCYPCKGTGFKNAQKLELIETDKI